MKYDACAFAGTAPVKKSPTGPEKNSIEGGLVGCLESIFFNDPYAGDEECAALLGSYVLRGRSTPLCRCGGPGAA